MGMRIMNNVQAQYAHRQLTLTNLRLNKSMEKLSSGYRINHASDDAAGLAISEKLRTQVKGLDQAKRNIQDGISLLQTAEGGLGEVHSILQRMRVLAVQSSNDTLTTSDRQLIQTEVNQLLSEIDRMTTSVSYNTIQLFAGAGTGTISIHAGADANQSLKITALSTSITTTNLSISNLSITSVTAAESAITSLTAAINSVSQTRSNIGASQNRLEHTYNFAGISMENQTAAESRIRDVDFASEMINFTKNQILAQAGNSMLSQANMRPQSVLQLLQ